MRTPKTALGLSFFFVIGLILAGLIFLLRPGPAASDAAVFSAGTRTPTLIPLQLIIESTATLPPTASPTPEIIYPSIILPTETPAFLPSVPPAETAVALVATVPQTAAQPATLPAQDWNQAAANAGGGSPNAAPNVPPGGCMVMTYDANTYINIRDYPGTSAGIAGVLQPNQARNIIAYAYEDEGLWYGLEKGWIWGEAALIYGDGCNGLPDASKVVWRSFGHVEFANTGRYREVRFNRIEKYMLNYPMLIFENGTIWRNPNGWP
jgi:hypothetical protein